MKAATVINQPRRRNATQLLFTRTTRINIIDKLIGHLTIRLDLDASLLTAFQPLFTINSSTSLGDLEDCHAIVAPDIDPNIFIADYYELLSDGQPRTALESLQKLCDVSPQHLHSIKTGLARILAAKPHSADVERLISKCS